MEQSFRIILASLWSNRGTCCTAESWGEGIGGPGKSEKGERGEPERQEGERMRESE